MYLYTFHTMLSIGITVSVAIPQNGHFNQSNKLLTPEQFIQPTAFLPTGQLYQLHTTTTFMKNLELITNHKTKCISILFVKTQAFLIQKQAHPVTKSFQQHFDHPLNLLLILKWEGRSEYPLSVSSRATSSTQSNDCTAPAVPLKNCFFIRTVKDNSWELCARTTCKLRGTTYMPGSTVLGFHSAASFQIRQEHTVLLFS